MSKYTIKKLIITIFFVLLLFFVFYITNIYKRNRVVKEITIVKKLLDDEYDEVKYIKDSSALYAYNYHDNIFEYDVFDLNGNNLYSIESEYKLNIESVTENYYILKNEQYELYNKKNELVISSDYLKSVNDYLIISVNTLIDYKGNVILNSIKDVDSVKLVYHSNYVSIDDYYFLNEKGKILLEGYKVVDEIENTFITNYIILKDDKKYYSYFPSLNNIIGVGFDHYFKDKDDIFIYVDYDKYIIYSSGFRSKHSSINRIDEIKKKYILDVTNIINDRYAFVTNKKDSSEGLLDLDSLDYYKLSSKEFTYQKIDNKKYLIKAEKNFIYDIESKKVIYESDNNLDSIIVYKNGNKCINTNGIYKIIDKDEKEVLSSDKQIVLLNEEIDYGIYNDDVSIYVDGDFIDSNIVTINSNKYLFYELDGQKNLYNLKTKESIISDYIDFTDNMIVYKENNNLKIMDLEKSKEYSYEFENALVINKIYLNSIVVEENGEFVVINKKGKRIKTIKEEYIKEIVYNDLYNKMVIITYKNENGYSKEGSYICQ